MVYLYRAMRAASNGQPEIGATARTLGVRPETDVVVVEGTVHPGGEGMSVTPDDPMRLPAHRRPPGLGGTGKDPVFVISNDDLGAKLRYRPDRTNPGSHGFIEPAQPMTFDAFQRAIAATQGKWHRHGS